MKELLVLILEECAEFSTRNPFAILK